MGKHSGDRIYMTLEIFDLALEIFRRRNPQVGLRRRWSDGTGQKLFALFMCDIKFPNVKLVERVREALKRGYKPYYRDGGPIAYEPLHKEDLRRIYQGKHWLYPFASTGLEAYVRDCMMSHPPKF